ncbi:hypothetical protein BJ912DRAFT_1109127 [Pholiota molesta]|nr:hypothetical protein BJ912DRAFT_1109127 [Pholiota molesta]
MDVAEGVERDMAEGVKQPSRRDGWVTEAIIPLSAAKGAYLLVNSPRPRQLTALPMPTRAPQTTRRRRAESARPRMDDTPGTTKEGERARGDPGAGDPQASMHDDDAPWPARPTGVPRHPPATSCRGARTRRQRPSTARHVVPRRLPTSSSQPDI